jgi:hypothetical protein
MKRFLLNPGRAGGWCGIGFVILLFVSAAMAVLPTAEEPGEGILAFYKQHTQEVTIQQLIGAIALIPFLVFAVSLHPNRWLMPAAFLLMACELLTNVIPLAIVLGPGLSAGAAHSLTVVEDLADAGLFISIALFLIAATLRDAVWIRVLALLVALACAIRAFASPLGVTVLDAPAPLAFVAFILLLSIRRLVAPAQPRIAAK